MDKSPDQMRALRGQADWCRQAVVNAVALADPHPDPASLNEEEARQLINGIFNDLLIKAQRQTETDDDFEVCIALIHATFDWCFNHLGY